MVDSQNVSRGVVGNFEMTQVLVNLGIQQLAQVAHMNCFNASSLKLKEPFSGP